MTNKASPGRIGQAAQVHDGSLSDDDYAALASFRQSLRAFMAFSERAAREAGLPPQQHQALLAIRGAHAGMMTVGDLAHSLLLKHHTTVGLVDRLVRARLVDRANDPDDRRRVLLTLTPKAEATLKTLSEQHLIEIRRNAPELVDLLRQLSAGVT